MSDFKYNAFISYSHQDKDWVRKKLLPCLEIAGLNICIDYRDFEIGAPSIINMENAIQYSHKTILVLTPQWIKSEWSKFEALLYQTDDPTNRWRRLLPILIEPCELPPRLKMLTYLDLTEISSTEYGEESQITRLINAIREGNSPLLIRGDASLTKGELRVLQDTNSIITQQDNLPPKTQFPPKTQEVKDLISNLQDSTAPDVSLQITTQVVDTDSHLSGSSSFEQKKSKDSTLTDKMDSLVLSYTYKQFSNNQHADQFSRTFEEHQKHIQEASQFLEHLNYQMHKGHQKVAGEEPRETSDESIMALGHIHLILSTRVQQILVEQRKSIPYLPDLARMSQDIHILNQKKGIPAVIIVGKGMNTARLRLYTSSYSIDLYTSHHQDGYSISSINVLTLHDHERMTQGVLWLRATEWTICTDFREISSDSSNNWQQISDAWFQLLSRQANLKTQRAGWQSKNITFEQQHYLDAISVAIEITRQLELDRDRLALGIIYNKVEFIGEKGKFSHNTNYMFYLVNHMQINVGEMLCLRDMPDIQGQVLDLTGNKMIIRFAKQLDPARIPSQGTFERIGRERIFQRQRWAVEALQNALSKNKHVLSFLVDHIYQSFQPTNIDVSKFLNSEQLEAVRRALSVPDMLLVTAPPGTGKDHVIAEIIQQSRNHHQHVLVISKTKAALESILTRLSDELSVVCFMLDERFAETTRSITIGTQARLLQGILLQKSESSAANLMRITTYRTTIDQRLKDLRQLIRHLKDCELKMHLLHQRRLAIEQIIDAALKSKMEQVEVALNHLKEHITSQQKTIDMLIQRRATAEASEQKSFTEALLSWSVRNYQPSIEKKYSNLQEALKKYEETLHEYRCMQEERQQMLENKPEYQDVQGTLLREAQEHASIQREAFEFVRLFEGFIQGLIPFRPSSVSDTLHAQALQDYLDWFSEQYKILQKRAEIIREWRKDITSDMNQLYPELLRSADVIGATCIDMTISRELEDLEFDLVIVNEAGQITLPDLLVPLTRAKRAVLIGDYQQLPPIIDGEIITKLARFSQEEQYVKEMGHQETDMELVRELLTTSIFEQLCKAEFETKHIVHLTRQYRLPQIIADFVSGQFYHSQLTTVGYDKLEGTSHNDPIFFSPLAFVDTTLMPQRAERIGVEWDDTFENRKRSGYLNTLEANLLVDIAAIYERMRQDWVLLVPYNAQVLYIRSLLRQKIEEFDPNIEERVATVGDYRGYERNIVLFGFTRSNTRGDIGLLKELRRLNVVMTRANNQLVMVGDISTLIQARDVNFRQVIQSLCEHVKLRGDWLSYYDCQARLSRLISRSEETQQ